MRISGSLAFVIIVLATTAEAKEHRCPDKQSGWQNKLVIHQIAVGQGDGAFIRTPSGTTILIDAGNPGRGHEDVLPTLKRCYGIATLDYIVVSHPHADHFGGVAEVLAALPVRKSVYDTGASDGAAYRKYQNAANRTGKRKIPDLGDAAFVTGDDVKIRVLAVNGKVLGGKQVNVFKKDGKPQDKNALSIALLISWGKFQFYTGGDLTGHAPVDLETPVANIVGDVDVLKSNHHGSRTANTPHFITKLRPEVILVSVGNGEANRRYHLPNAEVMARLMSVPFIQRVFQTEKGESRAPASSMTKVTDANGDVLVVASPESYSVNGAMFSTDGQ